MKELLTTLLIESPGESETVGNVTARLTHEFPGLFDAHCEPAEIRKLIESKYVVIDGVIQNFKLKHAP